MGGEVPARRGRSRGLACPRSGARRPGHGFCPCPKLPRQSQLTSPMTIITSLTGLGAWINAHALWPHLPVWSYALLTLLDTHVTTACVTLYLHRGQTHRSISFHVLVEHFMRFWLWVRTAMPTREWVAVHRCHHANVDTPDDPHSPIVYGIWRVLFMGTALYHSAAHN